MAQKQVITLHPGEVRFAKSDTIFATLLGSCVSIVIWHPHLKIGGMCHYLLPSRPRNFPERLPDGRYGDEALLVLLQAMIHHKTQPYEYHAWMVGGARILADQRSAIGDMNVVAGRAFLARYDLTNIQENVGGSGYRRIRFDIATGKIEIQTQQKDVIIEQGSNTRH